MGDTAYGDQDIVDQNGTLPVLRVDSAIGLMILKLGQHPDSDGFIELLV